MKTLKTVLLIASVAIFPLALRAGDMMKPETYYPIGPKLLQITQYQINKLNTPEIPLTAAQVVAAPPAARSNRRPRSWAKSQKRRILAT